MKPNEPSVQMLDRQLLASRAFHDSLPGHIAAPRT